MIFIMGVPAIVRVRFFLRFSAPALQGACAAAPVLKLFNQISRLEGI